MKILGIGNAIVDVICRVDDSFLKNHQLVKSTMKLIDENEFRKLLKNLKIEKISKPIVNQKVKQMMSLSLLKKKLIQEIEYFGCVH